MSRLALVLACGLALAAPSLADDNPPPICPGMPCGGLGHPPPAVHQRQADWKLVSEGITPVSTNRIFYARVPGQTDAWKSRLSLYDRTSQVQQDFTHTGLLAIFLTPRAIGFTIDGVYPSEDGSLNVQIHAAPPPPSVPECHPNPGEGCVIPIIRAVPTGAQYVLIAIRKGSLPVPVQRLYITEVDQP